MFSSLHGTYSGFQHKAAKAKARYFLLTGGIKGLLVAAIGLKTFKNPRPDQWDEIDEGIFVLTHRFSSSNFYLQIK